MHKYSYLFAHSLWLVTFISIFSSGALSFLSFTYSFVVIPVAEIFIPPNSFNFSSQKQKQIKDDLFYDILLYITLPLQYGMLTFYLTHMSTHSYTWWETLGKIFAMGICCGVMGINVGHELGHRKKSYEKLMAKLLLITSLYGHFFIDHNKGHHKLVGTPQDPTTAKKNQNSYSFIFQSLFGSFKSAWKLDKLEMKRIQLMQMSLIISIGFLFGLLGVFYFLSAAFLGAILLELVNYIEHYGLSRKINPQTGRFEKVAPKHSWNSNHILGRALLFELSRHSDHHANASKKYQTLRSLAESPQMPTGYPGMIVLALIPPLWFKLIDPKIQKEE